MLPLDNFSTSWPQALFITFVLQGPQRPNCSCCFSVAQVFLWPDLPWCEPSCHLPVQGFPPKAGTVLADRGGVQESLFLKKAGGKSQLALCSLSVVPAGWDWLLWASTKHLQSVPCCCLILSGVTCSKGGHGNGHKIRFSNYQGILEYKILVVVSESPGVWGDHCAPLLRCAQGRFALWPHVHFCC